MTEWTRGCCCVSALGTYLFLACNESLRVCLDTTQLGGQNDVESSILCNSLYFCALQVLTTREILGSSQGMSKPR